MVSQNLINISASALTSYVNCVKYHYYYMYWYMYVNSCNQYNVIWYICIVLRRYQMGREKSMNIMQKSRFIYSNHLYKFAVLLLVNFSDIYIECIYDTLVSPMELQYRKHHWSLIHHVKFIHPVNDSYYFKKCYNIYQFILYFTYTF